MQKQERKRTRIAMNVDQKKNKINFGALSMKKNTYNLSNADTKLMKKSIEIYAKKKLMDFAMLK